MLRSMHLFIVAVASIFSVSCVKGGSSAASSNWAISWSFENAGGTSPLNKDAAKSGSFPAMATFNSSLYAAWIESNGSANNVRVKATSTGTTWAFRDGGGTDGLNEDPGKDANAPSLAASDSKIFLAWTEDDAGVSKVRVKESSDGSTWTATYGTGTINVSPTESALEVRLAYFNSKLYAVWNESNATATAIRVKRYDGIDNWQLVDGLSGLNQDLTNMVSTPFPVVYNNKLYVTWEETDSSNTVQIRVKAYDGTSWAFVDGGAAAGMNYDSTKDGSNPKLAVFNSKLYLSWAESNGTATQIRVKAYNGTSWSWVDGGGTTGINVSATRNANNPFLAVFNSILFAIWYETDGTASQIRVKQYGGGSTWTTADSGAGLNSTSTQNAYAPWAVVFGSKLYVMWHEWFGSGNSITVKAGS